MIDIEISDHAKEAMEDDGISEDEIRQCIGHGKLEINQFVDGEKRYGNQLDLKDKKIMVIYTIRNKRHRVITAYTIQRKHSWQP